MNDYVNVIRPFVVIILTIIMYVVVVQLTNDPGCAALNKNTEPMFGEGFIRLMALCWW